MGCGPSKVDLDTFLVHQKRDIELIPGIVGDNGHSSLDCKERFSLTYGTDANENGHRSETMMLTLGGAPVGNISGEKGDGGGRGSYPKAWSSKTVLSDKDGKPAAIVTREVTVTGKTAIQEWPAKGHVAAKLSFATIYGAQPRCDGQPPAAGVTAPGDVPMYAWAQLKPWAGLKWLQRPFGTRLTQRPARRTAPTSASSRSAPTA